MTTSELAKFYAISPQAVGKWSAKKRNQKTTQALAGAEPPITNLIGEINQLAYVFDCQNLHGINQVKWCSLLRTTFMIRVSIFQGEQEVFNADINLNAPDALPRLLILKKYLMGMVYGNQAPSEVKI